MRVPAEPVDNRLVAKFKVVVARGRAVFEQAHGDFMNRSRLAVHVGHVEEDASFRRQR